MHERTESDEKLQRVLGQALRGLPLRAAPSTLESRVFSELERRAALPWWRRSFAQWPSVPRAAFVAVCCALIGATVMGGFSAVAQDRSLHEISALLLSWAQPALAVIASVGGVAALIMRVIPPLWLYGGMALGAMLYVALFGLGAAAYRTLYLRPSMAGDSL
jgi:hypothetical protein